MVSIIFKNRKSLVLFLYIYIKVIKNFDNTTMLILAAFFTSVVFAKDRKVPPRHPLQRLDRLVEFSKELLENWYDDLASQVIYVKGHPKHEKFSRISGHPIEIMNI